MAEHIVKCKWDNIAPIPEIPLAEYLLQACRKGGDKDALICGLSGNRMTYKELVDWVLRISYGMVQKGIKEGDVVCMITPNVLLAPPTFLASIATKATVTLANPLYGSEELHHHLTNSGSQWVMVTPQCVPALRDAIKGISDAIKGIANIKGVYVIGETSVEEYDAITSLGRDPPTWWHPTGLGGDSMVVIPYSSGTTGLPKGVMLTSHNWLSILSSAGRKEFFNVGSSDVCLGLLPFFHVFGLASILVSFSYGATTVMIAKFLPDSFLNALQTYKVTVAPIVPPLGLFLAKNELPLKYDFSSIHDIIFGAAPLSKDIMDELKKRWPLITFRQGYGMTEQPFVFCSDAKDTTYGTCGHLVAHAEAKVIDNESGTSLPHGKEGEICIRGEMIMKGYFNNESATKSTIDESGWLHTGDVGYYDENENFYIVDRIKELIKYKGFQVAPAELESLILKHEYVADVAVIGIPNDAAGELPRAYVVPKQGKSLLPEDIVSWVADHVYKNKQLHGGVKIVSSIPKSASGKILRRKLRDEAKKEDSIFTKTIQ